MTPPLFVRCLTPAERHHLEALLRAPDAFSLRRAQYLLASARGLKPHEIAQTYGGCSQTVRNVVRAFNAGGLDSLVPKSRRPKSACPQLQGSNLERLRHLLHQSPRTFGKQRSTWTFWKRAKHWITSPDTNYTLKKSGESV